MHNRSILALSLALAALAGLPSGAAADRAFVVNGGDDDVTVIDTETEAVLGSDIPVGKTPERIAMSPDGTRAYVTNGEGDTVSVIDTEANSVVATVDVGEYPIGVGVSPDGSRVYVTNAESDTVSVIDTATNEPVGAEIPVGVGPWDLAFTSEGGSKAFVSNYASVSVIDTGKEEVVGSAIPVGEAAHNIAISGTRAFVVSEMDGAVSVIDVEKEEVEGAPITVGNTPSGIAIAPKESLAFVSNAGDNTVSVIDVENEEVDETIESELGESPAGIAITPDGEHAYVANSVSGDVSVIEVGAEVVAGGFAVSALGPVASGVVTPSIAVGNAPLDIAFTEVPGPGGEEGGEEKGGDEGGGEEVDEGGSGSSSGGSSSSSSSAGASAPPAPPAGPAGGPGAPTPVYGKSVGVAPAKGVVKTKCKGQRGFRRLAAGARVPLGCLVDTRRGVVTLTSAGPGGVVQTADFWSGLFRIGQTRGRRPYTTLSLTGSLGCGGQRSRQGRRRGRGRSAHRSSSHADASRKKRRKRGRRGKGRRLWGKGKGRFRTRGRYGSATVRGTTWLVADRCNRSTLFKARRGALRVRDNVKKKNVIVRPGRAYVASPTAARGRR